MAAKVHKKFSISETLSLFYVNGGEYPKKACPFPIMNRQALSVRQKSGPKPMHEVVPSAVRNAVSAATTTFTASSISHLFFMFFLEGVIGSYRELSGVNGSYRELTDDTLFPSVTSERSVWKDFVRADNC